MASRYDQPDTGYAWVILVANFVQHLLVSSCFAPTGLLLVEYLERFDQSKAYTAGVGAMLLATWGLAGAVTGPLVQKFGNRRLVQVGTTLVVLGMGCSALAPSVGVLYITHGFITGVGLSCLSVSMSIVQMFFVRHRTLSLAVCMAGLSSGVFFWSNFVHFAITEYGYRGALVVMAGVNLNGYVIAALFRAPNFEKRVQSVGDVPPDTNTSGSYSKCNPEDNSLTEMESIDMSSNAVKPDDTSVSKDKQDSETKDPRGVLCTSNGNREYTPDSQTAVSEGSTVTVFVATNGEGKSILHQNDHGMGNEVITQQDSHLSITRDASRDFANGNGNVLKFHNIRKQTSNMLSNIIDVSLLKSPTFSLFCLSIFLGQSGTLIPYNFLPLRVSALGMSRDVAAKLITYFGIGSVIGRVTTGWVADHPWVNKKLMYACAHTLAGGLSCWTYFFSDYIALVTYCVMFAIVSACYSTLQNAIICDLVGLSQLAKGTGWSIVFFGLIQVLATSLAGHLIDVTGDEAVPSLVFGLVQASGGLVGFAVYIMARRQEEKNRNRNSSLTC